MRECPLDHPYLCNDNACAESFADCSRGVACGDGKSLCQDKICRETCG